MSVEAMKWAWEQTEGLKPTQKLLLLYLADRFNDKQGYAWPSLKRMSKDTTLSLTAIKSALNQLEKLGYIKRRRRFHVNDGSNFTSAIYLAHLGQVPSGELAPLPVSGWFDAEGRWDEIFEKYS